LKVLKQWVLLCLLVVAGTVAATAAEPNPPQVNFGRSDKVNELKNSMTP
jgi:hypothetical protein